MIKAAVIDDGINQGLYSIGELLHNVSVTPELAVCERADYDPYIPSHGTTCAAIIRKYAPEAVLSSVKILSDSTRRGLKKQLVKAIEWCIENNISVINLSLGTIDFRDFDDIRKVVGHAAAKGLIIVAACNNRNVYTCPASLPQVIGVKCDRNGILEAGGYVYNDFMPDGIDITACARHSIVNYKGIAKETSVCNSFAAPRITAAVYNIMKDAGVISLNEVRERLRMSSCKLSESVRLQNNVFINCKEIDAPVIAIYDCTNGKSIEAAEMLAALFKNDGYNAVATTDRAFHTGGCNDIVPLEAYSNNNSIQPEDLKTLNAVYDPDIMIACIDASIRTAGSCEVIETFPGADIKICMLGESADIERFDKLSGEYIILAPAGQITADANYFIYVDRIPADKVYMYIRELFDKEDDEAGNCV